MWSLVASFLSNLIVGLYKAWQADQNAKIIGQQAQQISTEQQAQAKVQHALQVASTIKPLTADELLSHDASNDPDFRD